MTSFARNIRPHVAVELAAAERAETAGDVAGAFAHLERAHILGQPSTIEHVRVHWRMFLWGWRQRSLHECFGQIYRLIGAATKTFIGLVPSGNTGGANVSPVQPMPVPPELAAIIERAAPGALSRPAQFRPARFRSSRSPRRSRPRSYASDA